MFQNYFKNIWQKQSHSFSRNRPEYSNKPSEWGPHLWQYLHTMAFYYDPVNYREMLTFLRVLPDTLPCGSCREHFRTYINQYNLEQVVYSKESLRDFFFELEDQVKERNGKNRY